MLTLIAILNNQVVSLLREEDSIWIIQGKVNYQTNGIRG